MPVHLAEQCMCVVCAARMPRQTWRNSVPVLVYSIYFDTIDCFWFHLLKSNIFPHFVCRRGYKCAQSGLSLVTDSLFLHGVARTTISEPAPFPWLHNTAWGKRSGVTTIRVLCRIWLLGASIQIAELTKEACVWRIRWSVTIPLNMIMNSAAAISRAYGCDRGALQAM